MKINVVLCEIFHLHLAIIQTVRSRESGYSCIYA
nr:MAG TPA: hypothetical protein [Caudoviricetes sp.]